MQANCWMLLLVLNTLWFGMGAFYFLCCSATAARLLAPREQRAGPLFFTLGDSIRFLGGLNLAFCVLCALLLCFAELFPDHRQGALFATAMAVAHGSQFLVNIPMIGKRRRQQAGAWKVLEGPMLAIFVTDGALMMANAGFAVWLLA